MMFGNEKSAEQRQKEKERRKRGTRKYGRAKFKNSRKGTISCISGAGAIFILAGCILYAFIARGDGSSLFHFCYRSGESAARYRGSGSVTAVI